MRDLIDLRDRMAQAIEAPDVRAEFVGRSAGIITSVAYTAPERMIDRLGDMQDLLESMDMLGPAPHWRAAVTSIWCDRPIEEIGEQTRG